MNFFASVFLSFLIGGGEVYAETTLVLRQSKSESVGTIELNLSPELEAFKYDGQTNLDSLSSFVAVLKYFQNSIADIQDCSSLRKLFKSHYESSAEISSTAKSLNEKRSVSQYYPESVYNGYALLTWLAFTKKGCYEDVGPLFLMAEDVRSGICKKIIKEDGEPALERKVIRFHLGEKSKPNAYLKYEKGSYNWCVGFKKEIEGRMFLLSGSYSNSHSNNSLYPYAYRERVMNLFNRECKLKHQLIPFSDDAELGKYCAKLSLVDQDSINAGDETIDDPISEVHHLTPGIK